MKNMRLYVFVSIVTIISIGLTVQCFANEIEWKMYLNSSQFSSPIFTKSAEEGEEIIVHAADFTNIPSESQELVNALEGVRLFIQKLPINSPVTIHIILNVSGNIFDSVSGTPLFINISFEAYVNGQQQNLSFTSISPIVMTIPEGSGLSYLLGTCSLSLNDDLVCVSYSGGRFTNEGVAMSKTVSGMLVKITQLTQLVGGSGSSLGFPSYTRVDTWSKIKLLFR